MNDAENPINIITAWIRQFSPRERDELSKLVFCSLTIDFLGDETGESLLEHLEKVGKMGRRYCVSQTLSFCSAVDFFVLPDRGSPSGWDNLLRVNEAVLTALLDKGHTPSNVLPLTDAIRELPLRRLRWLQQTERWRSLRKTSLSSDNIKNWLKITDRSWLLVPV